MKIICEGREFDRKEADNFLEDSNPLLAKLASVIQIWDRGGVPVMVSSGSTGEPHVMEHERAYIEWVIEESAAFMGIKGPQIAASTLPLDKAGGLMMVLRCLHFNWDLICLPPVADPFLKLSKNISYMALSPYQLQTVCSHRESLEQLMKVDTILLGGAAMSSELTARFQRHSNPVWLGFGLTETAGHIALRDIREKDEGYHLLNGVKVEANPWIHVKIDRFHIDVETRDYGYVASDKLYVSGRSMEWINSGGLKLYAPDMEARVIGYLSKLGYQAECIIVGIPHAKLGEQIHAVYSGDLPLEFNWAELSEYLKTVADSRLIPVQWHRISSIPRIQFKPDRRALVTFCEKDSA